MELNTNRDKIPQLYDWVIRFHAGSGPQYIVILSLWFNQIVNYSKNLLRAKLAVRWKKKLYNYVKTHTRVFTDYRYRPGVKLSCPLENFLILWKIHWKVRNELSRNEPPIIYGSHYTKHIGTEGDCVTIQENSR